MPYPLRPYASWPAEEHARWIHAGHTFGIHLMKAARDKAMDQLPSDASAEVRQVAEQAAFDAIYGLMQLLDGVTPNSIDDDHRVEYVLKSRILRNGEVVEETELAPDGDGLCMAVHGWRKGEFWD